MAPWDVDSPAKLIVAVHTTLTSALDSVERHLCALEHGGFCPTPGVHQQRAREMMAMWSALRVQDNVP